MHITKSMTDLWPPGQRAYAPGFARPCPVTSCQMWQYTVISCSVYRQYSQTNKVQYHN